jgi:hypothetical protein
MPFQVTCFQSSQGHIHFSDFNSIKVISGPWLLVFCQLNDPIFDLKTPSLFLLFSVIHEAITKSCASTEAKYN